MIYEKAIELAKALESGKYKQSKYALCYINDDGSKDYCCLGVASELIGDLNPDQTTSVRQRMAVLNSSGDFSCLSPKAREYYGFQTLAGRYQIDNFKTDSLMDMNDRGVSFKYIAATIRLNWEKL